jgi:hypothetical protein
MRLGAALTGLTMRVSTFTDLRIAALLVALAAACGARSDRAAISSRSASSTSTANHPPPTGAALLTIPFAPTAACDGGEFAVDGVVSGKYPVRRHPVPAGRHVIHISSVGDCGGYGDLTVELVPGQETELHPSRFR